MKKNYFDELSDVFSSITVTDKKGKTLAFESSVRKTIGLIKSCNNRKNKVIIIGNGGSASIASHISTDLLKNAGIPSIAFNDSSLITCLSNDLGYECVFSKPITMLAEKGDILLAISSSGKSANILNAVKSARQKSCLVITFSGFNGNNPLRKAGDLNIYVPSSSYGFVEIAHLALCHNIVDGLLKNLPHG